MTLHNVQVDIADSRTARDAAQLAWRSENERQQRTGRQDLGANRINFANDFSPKFVGIDSPQVAESVLPATGERRKG